MDWRIRGQTIECADGLKDELTDWLMNWRTDKLTDRPTGRRTDDWRMNFLTERLKNWWSYWSRGGLIEGWTDEQTNERVSWRIDRRTEDVVVIHNWQRHIAGMTHRRNLPFTNDTCSVVTGYAVCKGQKSIDPAKSGGKSRRTQISNIFKTGTDTMWSANNPFDTVSYHNLVSNQLMLYVEDTHFLFCKTA